MWFPCPMTKGKFSNDNDIIGYALSLLSQQFQEEDNWFAAQGIWWLSSIIQYTEILKYHLEYNMFPSKYLKECMVMPLPPQIDNKVSIPVSDIPELDVDVTFGIEEQTPRQESKKTCRFNTQKPLNTMRSGWVFKNKPKNQDSTIPEHVQRFGEESQKRRSCSRDRVRAKDTDPRNQHWGR